MAVKWTASAGRNAWLGDAGKIVPGLVLMVSANWLGFWWAR